MNQTVKLWGHKNQNNEPKYPKMLHGAESNSVRWILCGKMYQLIILVIYKIKSETFPGSSFSLVSIWCFSVPYTIVNRMSLSFVGPTHDIWRYHQLHFGKIKQAFSDIHRQNN